MGQLTQCSGGPSTGIKSPAWRKQENGSGSRAGMAVVHQEPVLPNVRVTKLAFISNLKSGCRQQALPLVLHRNTPSSLHSVDFIWLFGVCIYGASPQFFLTGPVTLSLSLCPGANPNPISKEGCDWNCLSLAISLLWPTRLSG